MHFLWHCLLTGLLFAAIDSVWIGLVANKFYKRQLGDLLLDKPKFGPAIMFYLIMIVGIVIFVVNPALGSHSFTYALGHGALLGVLSYATYDLTNASTLKGWSRTLTLVDMAWGTLVTSIVSSLAYVILR